MTRIVLILAVVLGLVATATAQPKPSPPRAVFDAEVVSIGQTPNFLCGVVMATQGVTVRVGKVVSGSVKSGETLTVRVMTCFGGPLLRPIGNVQPAGVFELDPDKIRAGSRIRIDVEDRAHGAWFATVDKIIVTAR